MSTARVDVIRSYLDAGTCDALTDYAISKVKDGSFGNGIERVDDAIRSTPGRWTSRMTNDRYAYPEIVRALHKRIQADMKVGAFVPVVGHGRDSVVVSITTEGSDVYPHRDPRIQGHPELSVLRCNILTSDALGGRVRVDDQWFELSKGDMMCYLVTEHTHEVTKVVGKTPRVLWMFGYGIERSFWERPAKSFPLADNVLTCQQV